MAIENVFSPPFRRVFFRALLFTVLLFIAIFASLLLAIHFLGDFSNDWLESGLAVGTGLVVFAAMFFLAAPVTALFAGLFLDDIAAIVEANDYPRERPGKPISIGEGLWVSVKFGLLVLLVNLILLPTLFFGVGPFLMAIANAYLLGREYFNLAAMRHMSPRDANVLRKENAGRIFAAGLIPAGVALIPVVNILVPLFATAYFVHIYKKIIRDG